MTTNKRSKEEKDAVQVSFRIGDDNLEPDKITMALGIKPSFSHKKGDIIPGMAKPYKRPSGLWGVDSPLPSNADVSSHLTAILNIIEPKLPQLKKIQQQGYGMDIAVGCIYDSNRQSETFTLPANLVQRLGKLGVEIYFTIYCACQAQSEPPETGGRG